MKKDARVYLAQILERIERIQEYTIDGKEAFFADEKTQDAVIRNFEVIGEAAKRIPVIGYRDAGNKVSCRRSPYERLGTLEGSHGRGGINL
jgi:uncharacterized protein with HEPN domain